MIRGLWSSLAGILPRMIHQEVASNNLANITTTGFKKDRPYMKSFLDAKLVAEQDSEKYARILEVEDVMTNYEQGLTEQTNNPLDLALMGDGFFTIQTDQGRLYSRNGNFTMNANSQLVTSEGQIVLGEGGPIVLEEGEVFINEIGEVSIDGDIIDKLLITDFRQPYELTKAANNAFKPDNPSVRGFPATSFSIKHKFLERSNVIPVQEMLNMIVYFRNYEADTRIIQAQDETLRRAVNDVGKL